MQNKLSIIIIGLLLYVLSAGGSYAALMFADNRTAVDTSSYVSPLATEEATQGDELELQGPLTEECPMNGKMYPEEYREKWETRRPLGIMVENHTEARPQSGLNNADITYEAVAEGGITRFLNIFYCADAKPVGPVRSARIYFIRLLEEYGEYPLYAHVGGANKPGKADALGEIKKLKWFAYNDMDPLYGMSFPYFWRDYERLPNRDTEHTVYTDTAKLWEFAAMKRDLTNVDEEGVAWDESFTPWLFKDDAASAERGTVDEISFGFWDQFANDYSVTWNYDAEKNTYFRTNGGKEHLDKNTDKPMQAKSVIVVLARESVVNDGYEQGQHLFYDIIGSGDGYIFQDGDAYEMSWEKEDGSSRMQFFDENGEEMVLTRGKLFVHIVPKGNTITY